MIRRHGLAFLATNLITDLLAFSVAVGPHKEDATEACLLLNVFSDRLLVLQPVLAKTRGDSNSTCKRKLSHLILNLVNNGRIEQRTWLTRMPFSMVGIKVVRYHVPGNTGENHI